MAHAEDWPQYMRDSQHTGDAESERIEMPLGLVAQIKLDDAVLSAPVVVRGRVYVVDQMGSAYRHRPSTSRMSDRSSW